MDVGNLVLRLPVGQAAMRATHKCRAAGAAHMARQARPRRLAVLHLLDSTEAEFGRTASRSMGAPEPVPKSEPIFNVPFAVFALIGLCVGVHLLRQVLPPGDNAWLTALLAFIPARLGPQVLDLPGGMLTRYTSFVTHLFVHGDAMHLTINSAWLLAFGTPVARRTDVLRFLALFLICGIAGAAFYVLVNGLIVTLLIGASGAISGLMGAAFRFLYAGIDAGPAAFSASTRFAPLPGLGETLRDRRVVTSIVVWAALNFLLAWGAPILTDAGGIAWEAHLGGFAAGFLLYGWFDRPPPPTFTDDEWAGNANAQ